MFFLPFVNKFFIFRIKENKFPLQNYCGKDCVLANINYVMENLMFILFPHFFLEKCLSSPQKTQSAQNAPNQSTLLKNVLLEDTNSTSNASNVVIILIASLVA